MQDSHSRIIIEASLLGASAVEGICSRLCKIPIRSDDLSTRLRSADLKISGVIPQRAGQDSRVLQRFRDSEGNGLDSN